MAACSAAHLPRKLTFRRLYIFLKSLEFRGFSSPPPKKIRRAPSGSQEMQNIRRQVATSCVPIRELVINTHQQ